MVNEFIVYRPASFPSDHSIVPFGNLYAWPTLSPIVDPLLQRLPVIPIAMGDGHCQALTADGRVFSWGANLQGGLGLGRRIPAYLPVRVPQESQNFCVSLPSVGHQYHRRMY